jgi:hypothetical protein
VALALAYLDYASDARGTGYANTVSETGWKLFSERTAEARRILKEASKLAGKCGMVCGNANGIRKSGLVRG